ncbi:unnamed protein product [Lathyrus sativus]|nr:unnamed protein product [Lathyrus sativus]
MAASTTSQVYIDVIEDVMVKVRDEFVTNVGGLGDEVLRELQAIWETKMIQAGAVLGPIERSAAANRPTPGGPITPVHDLNVPYEGTEEYETPTAEILSPPTPLQTPIQTPLPGAGETPNYNIPTGPSDYSSSGNETGGNADVKGGRPSPFMQPPSPWMNQRPPLDVNVAYVEGREEADRGASNQPMTQDFFTVPGGKRKRNDMPPQYDVGGYIPQQDGAGDAGSGDFEIEVCGGSISFNSQHTNSKGKMPADLERLTSRIPQLDGPIPYEDDVLSNPNIYYNGGGYNEDYNVANTPAPPEVPVSTPALVAQNEVVNDENDEPARVLVDAIVDNSALELLVQNLHRLSESDPDENAAIYNTLATIENLIEVKPAVAELVCEKTNLLKWLLGKIKVREFDGNKQYASEILAILVQSSSVNQKKFGADIARFQKKTADTSSTKIQSVTEDEEIKETIEAVSSKKRKRKKTSSEAVGGFSVFRSSTSKTNEKVQAGDDESIRLKKEKINDSSVMLSSGRVITFMSPVTMCCPHFKALMS